MALLRRRVVGHRLRAAAASRCIIVRGDLGPYIAAQRRTPAHGAGSQAGVRIEPVKMLNTSDGAMDPCRQVLDRSIANAFPYSRPEAQHANRHDGGRSAPACRWGGCLPRAPPQPIPIPWCSVRSRRRSGCREIHLEPVIEVASMAESPLCIAFTQRREASVEVAIVEVAPLVD
jgi:hypothetical protein